MLGVISNLKMNEAIFLLLYIPFLLLCFVILPAWVFFKRWRKVLGLVLACPGVFGVAMIISYFSDPPENDAGFVVFGMLFIVPITFFFIQAVVYLACNIVGFLFSKLGF